jgi:hypothetical protein
LNLPAKYVETHNPEIREKVYRLVSELDEIEKKVD